MRRPTAVRFIDGQVFPVVVGGALGRVDEFFRTEPPGSGAAVSWFRLRPHCKPYAIEVSPMRRLPGPPMPCAAAGGPGSGFFSEGHGENAAESPCACPCHRRPFPCVDAAGDRSACGELWPGRNMWRSCAGDGWHPCGAGCGKRRPEFDRAGHSATPLIRLHACRRLRRRHVVLGCGAAACPINAGSRAGLSYFCRGANTICCGLNTGVARHNGARHAAIAKGISAKEIEFAVIGTPLQHGPLWAIPRRLYATRRRVLTMLGNAASSSAAGTGARFFFGLQLLSWLLNPSSPVVKRSNPNYEYPPTVNRHLLTKCRPVDHFRHCQWRAW